MKKARFASLLLILIGTSFAQETDQRDVANIALEPVLDPGERVPLNTTVPDYPKEARRDRIEGEVEVCFNINRKGKPFRIGVRRSTHRLFEKPSIRAIRASSYYPLEPDEELSGIKTCRTFRFTLERPNEGSDAR